jgi:hypothetical protein
MLQLLTVGGDDETTEGFVGFLRTMWRTGTTKSRVFMPFMEPFVVLDGITEIGVGQGGGLFDELEGLTLGISDRVRITMFGHVRNDLIAKTVSEIETMSVRREYSRILFVLFI